MRPVLTNTLRILLVAGLAAAAAHPGAAVVAQDQPAPTPNPSPTPDPKNDPSQPAGQPAQPSQPGAEPLNPIMPGAEFEEPPPPPGATPGKGQPERPAAQPTKPMTPVQPNGRRSPRPVLPGAQHETGAAPAPTAFPELGPDDFLFGPYAEPVELKTLVDYVRTELNLSMIVMDPGFATQTVIIPVPIVLKETQVLPFLTSLLEQRGYTITKDEFNIYRISPQDQVMVGLGTDRFNTTRFIPTPGLKPSALQNAIGVLNLASGGGQGAKGPTTVFMDDLGMILMTGSSGQIALVEQLVTQLVSEQARVRQQRFEVHHIAASVARERIVELNAATPSTTRPGTARPVPRQAGQGEQAAQPAALSSTSGGLLALEDRLSVDPQSNALFYRGRPDELERFKDLLALVDVPNALVSRWYPVGAAADAIANAGRREGLGQTVVEEGSTLSTGTSGPSPQGRATPQPGQAGLQNVEAAGSGFVIYPDAGGFLYRGTEAQHERVKALVSELRDLATQELIVVEFYKLKHAKAEDVANLLNELVTGQQARAESPLLGRGQQGDRRRSSGINRNRDPRQPREPEQPAADAARQAGAGGDSALAALFADENTSIIADEKNNQIVVRAPKRLQPQYGSLINRIDIRRPQVFIDAQIVAVTDNEDFRLAVETALLAGEFAYNTNFGLGTLPATDIQAKKGVNTGLSGLTAALIKSDQVPIIINAIQQNVDGRILSTPQILVDDNETATITRKDRVPTQVASQSSNTTITSTGEDAEAGTTFEVTPTISEVGLKLEYAIELSSFTGSAASPGLPPPSQAVNIDGVVTVPSDATVVVGGLTVENLQNTVLKVPLLGDIPIVGQLFRDTSKTNQNVRVYIFLTPRVMRDPTFADLRLLTRGPLDIARVSDIDLPPPQPVRVDILESGPTPGAPAPGRRQPAAAGGGGER